jgi:Galactose oxidase, central domain
LIKSQGASIAVRKSHTAVTYKDSMVVFGGTSESGCIHDDMLVFNFLERMWFKIKYGGNSGGAFYSGSACSVLDVKKQESNARKVSF